MGWKTVVLLENCIISYLNDTAVTVTVGLQHSSLENSHHAPAYDASSRCFLRRAVLQGRYRGQAPWLLPPLQRVLLLCPRGH